MADEPRKESQDPEADNIFNSDIGDDWGEAFEAEDFMAPSQEDASAEFFLPEETVVGVQSSKTQPLTEPAPATARVKTDRLSALLQGHSLFARFRTLPLSLRIASVATPILVVMALTLFLPKTTTTLQQTENHPTTSAPAQLADKPTPPPAEDPTKHQSESTKPLPEKPLVASEKTEKREILKKWHFPAIIIQAKTNQDQEVTILSTDLTLVLKVHPEVMPPSAKNPLIREMIYQFYSNQPADDLRRFTLERGEMTRKLHAWITKQWPGLPLESVNVDRYQLL